MDLLGFWWFFFFIFYNLGFWFQWDFGEQWWWHGGDWVVFAMGLLGFFFFFFNLGFWFQWDLGRQ